MDKKKESRWQREQIQRRKGQTLRMIKWVLTLIFFILLVGIGWRIAGAFKNSVWDGKNRLNLVLNIKPTSLVSFDPGSQSIDFLIIPNGTYIEAVGGYGPYRIEKIYSLAEVEGKGMELISKSLETYFGLPVDGWLVGNEELTNGVKQLLSRLFFQAFKNTSLTNLSRWDLVRLWLMTNRTRAHRVGTINLGETTVAEKFTLPDGVQATRIDDQRLSRVISNLFTDERIRQENLAIALMNASGETGLAAKGAKLVGNIGGRLVEVGDWSEKLEICQIQATPTAKKSYTGKKLAQVFGCQFGTDLTQEGRWDLLVILTQSDW